MGVPTNILRCVPLREVNEGSLYGQTIVPLITVCRLSSSYISTVQLDSDVTADRSTVVYGIYIFFNKGILVYIIVTMRGSLSEAV